MRKKLLIAIAFITLFACTKNEDVLPEDQVKQVTLTCYSEKGIINLKYIDLGFNWIDTTINAVNYRFTYGQTEKHYQYSIQQKAFGADSIHIKAECEGKSVQHGFRSTGGTTKIGISLTELK